MRLDQQGPGDPASFRAPRPGPGGRLENRFHHRRRRLQGRSGQEQRILFERAVCRPSREASESRGNGSSHPRGRCGAPTQVNAVAQLEAGTLGLAITDIGSTTQWIRTKPLFQEYFACIFDPKVVRARVPISLKDYLAYPHLLTSLGGEFVGYVDEVLEQRGLARHVTMTTTRFSTLPFVLKRFRGIASLPGTAARELGGALGLTVSPLPVEVPPVDLSLVWHARHETDAGHQWLRGLVYRVCMRFAPSQGNKPDGSDRSKGRAQKAARR